MARYLLTLLWASQLFAVAFAKAQEVSELDFSKGYKGALWGQSPQQVLDALKKEGIRVARTRDDDNYGYADPVYSVISEANRETELRFYSGRFSTINISYYIKLKGLYKQSDFDEKQLTDALLGSIKSGKDVEVSVVVKPNAYSAPDESLTAVRVNLTVRNKAIVDEALSEIKSRTKNLKDAVLSEVVHP